MTASKKLEIIREVFDKYKTIELEYMTSKDLREVEILLDLIDSFIEELE